MKTGAYDKQYVLLLLFNVCCIHLDVEAVLYTEKQLLYLHILYQ